MNHFQKAKVLLFYAFMSTSGTYASEDNGHQLSTSFPGDNTGYIERAALLLRLPPPPPSEDGAAYSPGGRRTAFTPRDGLPSSELVSSPFIPTLEANPWEKLRQKIPSKTATSLTTAIDTLLSGGSGISTALNNPVEILLLAEDLVNANYLDQALTVYQFVGQHGNTWGKLCAGTRLDALCDPKTTLSPIPVDIRAFLRPYWMRTAYEIFSAVAAEEEKKNVVFMLDAINRILKMEPTWCKIEGTQHGQERTLTSQAWSKLAFAEIIMRSGGPEGDAQAIYTVLTYHRNAQIRDYAQQRLQIIELFNNIDRLLDDGPQAIELCDLILTYGNSREYKRAKDKKEAIEHTQEALRTVKEVTDYIIEQVIVRHEGEGTERRTRDLSAVEEKTNGSTEGDDD